MKAIQNQYSKQFNEPLGRIYDKADKDLSYFGRRNRLYY